jgi:uncharacterized membrane protein YeaQ/YmgE (transglycosylase-associated protein family)
LKNGALTVDALMRELPHLSHNVSVDFFKSAEEVMHSGYVIAFVQMEDFKMNFYAYLVVGFIVGCIATSVVERKGLGPLGLITIGMAGALIGGLSFNRFGVTTYGIWDSLVTSLVGAIALLVIVRFFYSKNRLSKF